MRAEKKGSFRPDRELLRLLPRVLRARDFHLYLENGKRLTDLWLQGGKAVLGHKPPRVLTELKNAAERGLFTALPHPAERRFFKALEGFFHGRTFRLYADEGSLYRALEEAGFAGAASSAKVHMWRPFLGPPDENALILIPVLPFPLGPAVLVLEKSLDDTFPPGDLIPPVLLAPAGRALYDLAAALKAKAPNRGNPRYSKIERVLKGSMWRRRGIYLTVEPAIEREKYETMFRHFLEGGFLIPPSQAEPLILPASMSPGEEAKLAGLLGLSP
ncbi:MAG: hypothetical protein FWC45_01475 [Treponema sp.]|nr:hypothetical protein [Treponema sp.]